MPITIGITPSTDPTGFLDYLILDWELLAYLRELSQMQGLDLSALAGLDPYGDTVFTGEQLTPLGRRLQAVHAFLQDLYRQEKLPANLEPPALVGLETDPDGEPCGRAGVLAFLARLIDFCSQAAEQELAISAVGD